MVYRKTKERTSSDLTVGRLTRRDIRNPQLQRCLQEDTTGVLRNVLKSTELSVYAVIQNKMILGFVVTKHVYGDPTLHCLYMHELVPGSLNRFSLLLILDYTGFTYMDCPAPTLDCQEKLLEKGFVHAVTRFKLDCGDGPTLTRAKNLLDVSGDRYDELPSTDRESINFLISNGILVNLQADPVGRPIHLDGKAETIVQLIRHVNHYSFVWREGGRIVGFIQAKIVANKSSEITSFFVECSARKKGIGIRLLNHVSLLAREHGATLYTEFNIDNDEAKYLFNCAGFKEDYRKYVLVRDDNVVSWERRENRVKLLIENKPVFQDGINA